MKRFLVTEERPVMAVWTFEVEAETETEALEQVQNGNVMPEKMNIEDHGDLDDYESTYEVEEQQAFKIL